MLRRHLRNPRNRCILLPSRLVCDGVWRRNQNIPRESDTLALSYAVRTSYLPHSLNAVATASVSGKQVGTMSQRSEIAPRERTSESRLYKESCDCTSTRADHAAPYSASVTTRQRYQRGAISSVGVTVQQWSMSWLQCPQPLKLSASVHLPRRDTDVVPRYMGACDPIHTMTQS